MGNAFNEAWLKEYQARRRSDVPIQAPTPQPRGTPEHDFQVTAIDYLRLVLPPGVILTSIDHANAKSRVTGALRKRRGVMAGLPDIYVASGLVTVWLECKAPKGRLSDAQKAFRDAALRQCHFWFAVRTIEEIQAALAQTPLVLR